MNEVTKWILLAHVGATLSMVGLIWFVQIVHYPLLAQVGRDSFRRYELDHQRLTTWVVAPLMLAELTSATLLLWWKPPGIAAVVGWSGLGLLAAIWIVTYAVQVPQHAALVVSYESGLQKRLVAGNWFRTAAWTARGMLVLWMVSCVISSSAANSAIVRVSTGTAL